MTLTVKVVSAFKATGGASEKYQQSVDFLKSLETTLTQVKQYIEVHPTDKYAAELGEQLQRLPKPWGKLESFIKKYGEPLAEKSKKLRLRKIPKIIKYTLKDLNGEVQDLKLAISIPLQVLQGTLSLQQLYRHMK